MRFSIDPVPIGAFIEYTLKPLLDDSRELIELLDKHGIKAGDVLKHAVTLYIIDLIGRITLTLGALGIICFTALRFLATAK